MTMGRPTLLTEEIRSKIDTVAAFGATFEEVAFYIGVHRQTLYRWMADDPDLRYRIEELQEKPVLKARETVVKALSDPAYAFKYLEKKRKKEFGASLDITTDNQPINSEAREKAATAITEFLNEYRGNPKTE